jgi:hypothetical protein
MLHTKPGTKVLDMHEVRARVDWLPGGMSGCGDQNDEWKLGSRKTRYPVGLNQLVQGHGDNEDRAEFDTQSGYLHNLLFSMYLVLIQLLIPTGGPFV